MLYIFATVPWKRMPAYKFVHSEKITASITNWGKMCSTCRIPYLIQGHIIWSKHVETSMRVEGLTSAVVEGNEMLTKRKADQYQLIAFFERFTFKSSSCLTKLSRLIQRRKMKTARAYVINCWLSSCETRTSAKNTKKQGKCDSQFLDTAASNVSSWLNYVVSCLVWVFPIYSFRLIVCSVHSTTHDIGYFILLWKLLYIKIHFWEVLRCVAVNDYFI